MNKQKQNELAEFLDWAKEYTNNKLDYGSSYLAQQYIKKHPPKTEIQNNPRIMTKPIN